mmetsp:Transcript_91665/g.163141  ORF Transcript_91665/g.163141 Transcript_91665/m.163141 type:complete len:543 (-) Transcript_91665:82-1710(-)|eukprot:CAMPEP_0197663936 /NCGR_PEP_ID=MMETSP1338-20131121/58331_1 /TAXON_ID=43686 ORGANISM="Pelagodinium beii, Strain RCC1491" /NCGR_SAMPLE_ID=MMETSP1338 /ASSEMBLY_ACC=CAM_ASM_000754 /LENGTH=542 /DNA_ID=CAMNT_0043242477 /DNA_START=40 /DNA_END=1668 /DNA_ORIENTATION=-
MTGNKTSGIRNDMLLPDAVRTYVTEHKLESVVTKALNTVIQQMPEEPFAALAQELSQSSKSAPRLCALRPDTTLPRENLRFDIVVVTRGVRVRIYSLALQGSLEAVPEPKEEEEEAAEEAPPPETDNKKKVQELEKLISFLQDFFVKGFGDVYVDDFLSFHERCDGISGAPLPGGIAVDVQRATVSITNQLLDSGACSLKLTPLAFLQRALSNSCELVSPPLRDPRDYALWRWRWPRFSMPIFYGGGPSILRAASLRCCAVFSPFTVQPPPLPGDEADPEAEKEKPEPGWIAGVVEFLRSAQAEAVKSLQADKATATLAVDGLAYALPGGLVQTVQMAEKSAEAALLAAGGNSSQGSSGVLLAYADEAWLEEEEVYEVETGKQISLEELVELYAEAAESGWLSTIVNPFRAADVQAGCELLKARKPELKLVQDYGAATVPPQPSENSTFGCMWHLPETLPLVLKQYAERAPIWQENADGFGGCTVLTSAAAASLPAIFEALMACSEVQTIFISDDISAEDVQKLSERNDEMMQRVELSKVPE